jgi:uncharacterized phage protein gp47/JayE
MIEYPELEIRNEDELAAQAIARVSGGLTTEIVEAQIRERQELLALILAGLNAPICPELTNANPSAPHTVLLEAQAWLLAQMAYRINRVPEQNHIAFANLFGIEPRPATGAETTLRFTVDAPNGTDVTIPVGTQISDDEGKYIFETVSPITILSGTLTGTVLARRIVAGHTLLAPNVLTTMIDSIGFVEAVTNLSAVDSGTEIETLSSTLERVKRYQRRGERLVSAKDLEDAILDEALSGNGIVRAFPFIVDGQFPLSSAAQNQLRPGHTTVVVMTRSGDAVDSATLQRIGALLEQRVGNQFVYIVNPFYLEFNVTANVRLNTGSPQGAVVTAIETNLRAFYAANREQFGRPILRSEIIAVIEGTAGVDRIESVGANILTSPTADVKLKNHELPKLVNVNITVV